jgi:hypothetical protein
MAGEGDVEHTVGGEAGAERGEIAGVVGPGIAVERLDDGEAGGGVGGHRYCSPGVCGWR